MPTPLTFDLPDYQNNETLKSFDSTDALAKGYLDLETKVKSGSIDILPEEMRKDSTISKFKSITELAKGYVEADKMIGGIKKAPGKPEEYKFTPMEKLHPSLKQDGISTALRPIFHKAGLHNEAADMVQQEVLTVLSNGMAQNQKAKEELAKKNETALRAEWGADFDKNLDRVVLALTKAGGAEAIAETDGVSKALKGSPVLLKALGKIMGMLSEDSIGKLGEGADVQVTDKTEALKKIEELKNQISSDPKHPFKNVKDPKHDEFMKEWTRLHTVAFS